MAKRNYKYVNSVDLSNVRKKNNKYNWKESIGCKIPFTFDDNKLIGEFTLIDYKKPKEKDNYYIYLEYNGNKLKPILPIGLKNATLSNILDEFYIDWGYDIGDVLVDEKRNITITNRFREKDKNGYLNKYYQIRCNLCGFDSGEHYIKGEYRNKWFCGENDLKRCDNKRINCPCCNSHVVKVGINDIPSTDEWMVDYFKNGYEDAKKYSYGSFHKEYFRCVFCGRIDTKPRSIQSLYRSGMPCVCRDHISYPNKFAYYMFEELREQYSYYINEYSPKWSSLYKYDNYFEKNGRKYIVEMDGSLGHGHMTYTGGTDTLGLHRDNIKDNLAKEHNIEMIRIDCAVSDWKYISNNIIKSKLSSIFDLSLIDFKKIDTKSKQKNIYKDICDYYLSKKPILQSEIAKNLSLSRKIVCIALNLGNKIGWIKYTQKNIKDKENRQKAVECWKINNGNIRVSEIAKEIGLGVQATRNALIEASNNGEIIYDNLSNIKQYHASRCKPIIVCDCNGCELKRYKSSKDCEINSMKDFGIQFNKRNISGVASGEYKTHKGYKFIYA